MQSFLEATQPYSVDPLAMGFALLGIEHHAMLEKLAENMSELKIEDYMSVSHSDLLEADPYNPGCFILNDYKTWGSYKLMVVLGMEKVGKGKEASFIFKKPFPSDFDTDLQLNHYKVKLEENYVIKWIEQPILDEDGEDTGDRKDVPIILPITEFDDTTGPLVISHLQVQCTVRDSGLAVAMSRGITSSIQVIPIQILDRDVVVMYFTSKAEALDEALDLGDCKQTCNELECWVGRKCADYCDVWRMCSRGQAARMGKMAGDEFSQ